MARPLITPRRRLAALVVVAAVVVGHAWLGERVAALLPSTAGGAASTVQRMDVAFVRELQPTEPPPAAAAPPPAPKPRRRAAAPVARPASSPASEAATEAASSPASAPDEAVAAAAPEPVASEPPPTEAAAADTLAAASTPVAAAPASAAASGAAPAFEWPPSTRLDYLLTGWYRGEVQGQARVQWIRQGGHYQVQVDVVIGPAFAPLVARRMTSDGEITAEGLAPLRYEEETTSMFGQPRRRALRFEPERIVLDRGSAPAMPGVQDTASQFVQLTWLFTTQPQRLRVGEALDFPLALPRRVDRWFYDVVAKETLHTRIGEVEAFHVKPRRDSPRPGELTAELWVAPSFQYLPVRILIRQDADTWVDLVVKAPPLQTP